MVYDDVITPSKACFLCVRAGTYTRGHTNVDDNLGRSLFMHLANGVT